MTTRTSTDSAGDWQAGDWLAVDATDKERLRFANLDAVLTIALDAPLAAPANRLRQVRVLDTPDGRYFLKEFAATQPKNRLKFLTTRPRARDDAAREGRMACALRSAGIDAPRVVGMGRNDGTSYLLLAQLQGESLRDLLAKSAAAGNAQKTARPPERSTARATARSTARAAAKHCGNVLRQGFDLPDLSLDHVFVHGDDLALLDLHNGSLRTPGPPRARTCVRVLRRFTKSARGLNISRGVAVGFAGQLLRAADVPKARRRRILERMPPWDTATRYEAAGKSHAYRTRNPKRHAVELKLLHRVWPQAAPLTAQSRSVVLDAPCGAGRLLPFLTERGHAVMQSDGARAMLREARDATPSDSESRAGENSAAVMGQAQSDARALPFVDHAVDGCVVFRFIHHLPPNEARDAVREACRVARDFVVMSFFHPVSAHAFQRSLKLRWSGRARTRFAVRPKTLNAWFRQEGFRMKKCKAEARFLKDFWVASWVRDSQTPTTQPARDQPPKTP